ncbi:MAG: DinB family protein [Vicinamibacteraceae bacterium]
MPDTFPHDDLAALDSAYDAIDRDARTLIDGLSDAQGTWREAPGKWTVAECLDHLATGNRVYLDAMRPAAERAAADGRTRRGPARPGLIGGWFARLLEPPARPLFRTKAPRKIQPRVSPPLGEASATFLTSLDDVRAFLRRFAVIDLAGVTFPNPLVPGIRFSLATGLHVLAAHQRRHLWQGWNVRRSAEQAAAAPARP